MADEPKKSENPVKNAPAAAEVAHHEDHEVLEQLKEYIVPIAFGAAAAVVVFLGFAGYKANKQSKLDKASILLTTANGPSQLQEVINTYKDTPSAPVALLSLAAENYHSQQYDQALMNYKQFASDYPKHPMVASAQLGQAYALEALNNYQGALDGYKQFVANNKGHYLEAMAVFGQARCLKSMGKYDEARIIFEDFKSANPESNWEPQADLALRYVEMEERASKKGPAPAPLTVPKTPTVVPNVQITPPEAPAVNPAPVVTPPAAPEAPPAPAAE